MRYILLPVVIVAVAISLAAIASAVLPTKAALPRWALIGIGIAAAAVGVIVAFAVDGLIGIIVGAVAAFVFVFLYDRIAAK